jgi:DUF4097 and DUF4098 domain-containing protein YvlB
MTDKSTDSRQSGAGGNERKESFISSGPVRAKIATLSGDITVHASEGPELEITLSATSSKYHYLLGAAEIKFDAADNQLDVRTRARSGLSRGKDGKKKSWFDFGGSDLDVFVVLPQGSTLQIKTISGDSSLEGPFDDIDVSSISGDVGVIESCNSLDVRTASGDVGVGPVDTVMKCRTASGDVQCLSAAAKTEIVCASGEVNIMANQPGQLTVKVVSGDVHVSVARGLCVDVHGNTVSGEMSSDIDLDATGDTSTNEEEIAIKITTVSGDIRIDKA